MKSFYKIGLFGLIYLTLFGTLIASASFVSAGPDDTRGSGDYSLSGTYQGLTGCNLSIVWSSSDLHIENTNSLTGAYIPEDFLIPATGGNYNIQLIIKTDVSGCTYSGDNLFSAQDTMILCVPNDGFSCTEETPPASSGGGGRSRASRMRDEATHIFATTGSIENIELNLTKRITFPNTLFALNRNYIGGDGAIKYEIEYSTGSNFNNTGKLDIYRAQVARRRTYNIYINDLSQESVIHYFRVRAVYKDKHSKRSNIVDYINEDNPLSQYIVNCEGCQDSVSFGDIWYVPDILIEAEFNTSCDISGTCGSSKVRYDDAFESVTYTPLPIHDDTFNNNSTDDLFVASESNDTTQDFNQDVVVVTIDDIYSSITKKRQEIETYRNNNPNQNIDLLTEIDNLLSQSQISLSYEYLGDAILQIKQSFRLIERSLLINNDTFNKLIEDITKHIYQDIYTLSQKKVLSNRDLVSESLLRFKENIDDGQYIQALHGLLYTYFLISNEDNFIVDGNEFDILSQILASMGTYASNENLAGSNDINQIKNNIEQKVLWKYEDLQNIGSLSPVGYLQLILDLQDISNDLSLIESSKNAWVRDREWSNIQLIRIAIEMFKEELLLSSQLGDQNHLIQGMENIYNISNNYIENYNIDILLDLYSSNTMKCLVLNAYRQANFVPAINPIDYGCDD